MFSRETWGEILQSIGKNKLRTVLTGFAVFWGIFMLIILLGLGSGLRNGFSQGFANTATNSISIWGGETSKPWNGLPANRDIQLDEDDVAALRNAIPGLEHISGSYRVWRGASQVQYGKNFGSYDINGIMSEHQLLQRQTVVEGRFINEVDEREARKVIVIADDARKELFKEEPFLNEWVNVNGVPFQVVGLYKFENAGEGGMMRRSPVFIPLSCAQKVFNANREVRQIMFSFADASPQGAAMAEDRARHTLARNHNFDPTDDRALWLENNVENVGTFNNVFTGISIFIWFIGIGSLLAGIVGIGNIMLIVVKDRTKELGIRKAMGATPANVIAQVMLEALFVTVLFGYFGLAFAVLLLEGLAAAVPGNPYFENPTIDFRTAIYSLAAMIAAGAMAGYFPARRAAAIQPIEALRDE
jgi:putative ABC transport system permease protein